MADIGTKSMQNTNRLFVTFITQIYKSCLKFRAKVLLLVKCYYNKMVKVTLQLRHLTVNSASGG